jgi:hypothetical protein
MPKTGYVKLRSMADVLERFNTKPSKASEKAYNEALKVYLGRVHKPRLGKKKG